MNNKWSRIIALIIMLLFTLCLSGCQKSDETMYRDAQSLLRKGQFAEAAVAFDELGNYEDSSKLSMYCKAAAAGENGDYDTAFSTFRLLGDYKESQYMIPYYQARKYESVIVSETRIQWNYLISAAEQYDLLTVFRDSKERAESCRKRAYDYAVEWAGKGQYNDAIHVLDALGNYSDSVFLKRYYEAFQLEQNHDYIDASAKFNEIRTYKDAQEQAEKVMQRGYDYASSLEADGDQMGAYTIFMSLGDYRDSFERACKPYYLLGESYRASQDWDKAVQAFRQAGDYSDSMNQIQFTRYTEGITKRESHEWDGSVAAFEQAGEYKDAIVQIKTTRYLEAETKRDAKDYVGAIAIFEAIKGYQDSEIQFQECSYQLALEYINDDNMEDAIDILRKILNYKDTATIINRCFDALYNQAIKYRDQGDVINARYLFFKCRGYKDSDEILSQMRQKYSGIISTGGTSISGLKSDGTVLTIIEKPPAPYSLKKTSEWTDITAVSASDFNTMGLRKDGRVVVVGDDDFGATYTSGWTGIDKIYSSSFSSYGYDRDKGTLYSVGGSSGRKDKKTYNIGEVKDFAISYTDVFCVLDDGTVKMVPVDTYKGKSSYIDVETWTDIIQITLGNTFVVGLKSDGSLATFTKDSRYKWQCNVEDWKDIIAIASGDEHTVGLKADGTVVSVGSNNFGQRNVSHWKDIVAIDAKDYITVGLKADGTVVVAYEYDTYSQAEQWKLW